jgi:hypothetical protein
VREGWHISLENRGGTGITGPSNSNRGQEQSRSRLSSNAVKEFIVLHLRYERVDKRDDGM